MPYLNYKVKRVFSLLLTFTILLFGCKKEEVLIPVVDQNYRQVDYSAIVGWGDSLTKGTGGEGTSYLGVLSELAKLKTYNMGIAGEVSAQIKSRMIMNDTLQKYPTIIWVGRNNITHGDDIKKDIAAMVANLKHSRYIVLGILNGENMNESRGDAHYNVINTLNDQLGKIYGSHYIDIRSYLVSQFNPADLHDVANYNENIVPASLRNGNLHLNANGYKLVAKKIYENISLLENVPALDSTILNH